MPPLHWIKSILFVIPAIPSGPDILIPNMLKCIVGHAVIQYRKMRGEFPTVSQFAIHVTKNEHNLCYRFFIVLSDSGNCLLSNFNTVSGEILPKTTIP